MAHRVTKNHRHATQIGPWHVDGRAIAVRTLWLAFTLLAMMVLLCTASADETFEDGALAELMAAVDQERILGMDYFSSIIPSTSKCIGDNSTPLCFVDTYMACRTWMNRPDICNAIGAEDWQIDSGPWRYSRFRYRVTLVDILDESTALPWLPPLDTEFAPAKDNYCHRFGTMRPEAEDMALVVEARECVPGGPECIEQMTELHNVAHDICIRIEPCYGDLMRVGLVLRHIVTRQGNQAWRLVELWSFYGTGGVIYYGLCD